MFDVHFFQSLLGKNNLALMGEGWGEGGYQIILSPLTFILSPQGERRLCN